MKRLAILCACTLALSLTACSLKPAPQVEVTTPEPEETTVETTETTEPAAEATETEEDVSSYATLADGWYNSSLISEPEEYTLGYVKSAHFVEGGLVIEASFYRYENEDWDNPLTFDFNTYYIPIDENTTYQYSGGEEGPTAIDAEEFKSSLERCMGNGLGFGVGIENGVAYEFEFFS